MAVVDGWFRWIWDLGLSDALGLVELASPWRYVYASSSAKGREIGGGNRSVDRLIQNNLLGGRERRTAVLGTK